MLSHILKSEKNATINQLSPVLPCPWGHNNNQKHSRNNGVFDSSYMHIRNKAKMATLMINFARQNDCGKTLFLVTYT